MRALTLRGLAARKVRTALTAMAVVLGVAMISGTYVLTDTIDRSFGTIFTEANQGVDVAVVPSDEGPDTEGSTPGFSEALVERVRRTPGIASAEGSIFDFGITVRDPEGEVLPSTPPTFAASAESSTAFRIVDGRFPRAADEVTLDRTTAEEEAITVGETIEISGTEGARDYRVVGIASFGSSGSVAGATVAILTLAETQRVLGKEGRVDGIDATAAEGVTAAEATRRVRAALRGERVEVRTGEENAARQTADIQDEFGFLRTALLVFAGIAVFVGAFVIYNTFSITVAQRTRELALLRTLGASRNQVLRSVVAEAALVGLAAALVGLAAGLLVAPGIVALFKTIGFELPSGDTVVAARTVVVALVVGVVVTVVASLAPALRATRVPPVAALREGFTPPRRSGRVRTAFAALLGLGGAVAIGVGLFGGQEEGAAASLLGLGAALVFLAVALLSPVLVPPLARAVGAPIEAVGGLTGRLARENATRNPARTAVTAAALMIGLALVTFVTIFAAGLSGSIDRVVDRSFAGDLTIVSEDGFTPVSAGLPAAVQQVPGVERVSGIRFALSDAAGREDVTTVGVDPRTVADVYRPTLAEGSSLDALRTLGPDEAFVDRRFAEEAGLALGERVRVLTPTGARPELRVAGLLDEGGFGLLGNGLVVSNDRLERDWREQQDAFVFTTFAAGADAAATRRAVDRLLAERFPGTESQDREEVKEAQAGQIAQVLGLFYALLALSVIVSLFGLVNTLALSIFERTRELGMLRAIGTSRRQVRRTVRYEAAITALIGAVLGLVLGVLFALVVSRPLEAEGFTFALPVLTLLALLAVSAVLGVLAAILPARRAARVDVLRALAYE
jgi:putative ABC transport system permease protein